jgi:DNA-binding beta-propeller fold protein YncE
VVNELAAVDPLTGELLWTMTAPNAHELAVTHNGEFAYVSCRTGNRLRIVDLEEHEIIQGVVRGPLRDTLQLSANEKLLTVGLRGSPAQIAVLNTETLIYEIVTIASTGTIAGQGPHGVTFVPPRLLRHRSLRKTGSPSSTPRR